MKIPMQLIAWFEDLWREPALQSILLHSPELVPLCGGPLSRGSCYGAKWKR